MNDQELMPASVKISDHDLLVELNTNVKALREDIKSNNMRTTNSLNDHESRLRLLEADNAQLKGSRIAQRWMISIVGAIGVIANIIALLNK